jgi:hypothetical protein
MPPEGRFGPPPRPGPTAIGQTVSGADQTVDLEEGRRRRERVSASMAILRAATPEAGSYVNETDYFEPEWQSSFWGASYARLLSIKRRYDPGGMFTCHHCVGSEER